MLEKEVLDNIVNEITDNYHSEELFYLKSGHCMPNRDTITHIIMGLRQLMFPGYFDNENLNKTVPEFFVGHNITKIYNDLYCQIKAAFLQIMQMKLKLKNIQLKYVQTFLHHSATFKIFY